MLLVLRQEFQYNFDNFDNFLNTTLAWQDAWKSLYLVDSGCTHGYKFASIWTFSTKVSFSGSKWDSFDCVPRVYDLWNRQQILSSIYTPLACKASAQQGLSNTMVDFLPSYPVQKLYSVACTINKTYLYTGCHMIIITSALKVMWT